MTRVDREQQPILFAMDSSREFGERMAAALGVALSPHEERNFEDGEHKSRPLVSVRNRDVFVISSLYGDQAQTVSEKLCRLLFFLGAVRDASAGAVTAIVPYLCYSRKDRRTKPRDPVTTRYVAGLFESVGIRSIVTMDVHNPAAYENAFHRAVAEHLEAVPLLLAHVAAEAGEDAVVVASPDAGGIKRAERFRQALHRATGRMAGSAFMEKYRSSGRISGDAFVGDVEGKSVILIDDLISSGSTLARAAAACRARGAVRIQAAATHGLFVGDAMRVLEESALDGIIVTNTVPAFRLSAEFAQRKLVVLDSSALFAEAVRRLHGGGSINDLLDNPD